MFYSFLIRPAVITAAIISLTSAAVHAADFSMGNVDQAGSRSIPAGAEGNFTMQNVAANGLRIKWSALTAADVSGAAATFDGAVYVGDLAGYMYAFDQDDGTPLWSTCLEVACPGPFFFSGIIGNPLIRGDTVYVGTLSGSLVALDAYTGAVRWRHTPLVTAPVFGLPLDSVWGGPISVRNMVIYALAPNDEFGLPAFGRGAVLAVNAVTGAEIWRAKLISDADYASGSGGAGVWNSTPTYSPELDMIFVGTGQDTNPAGGDAGSDSFFAIDAQTGTIVWQTQVRTGDTWSQVLPFDPLNPTDTDIGASPAVFKIGSKIRIAAGDKRGIFWVLDATNGTILNNGGVGLDMFEGVLPGPGLTGGFNLDSGFVKSGNNVKHFAVFSDQTTALQGVVDYFEDGVCGGFSSGGIPYAPCPLSPDTGNLLILDANGEVEVCRFSAPNTQIFSPLYIGGMVAVRGADDGILYVVNFSDCSLVTALTLPTGWSFGANLSFADGVLFTGSGAFSFVPPQLMAIEVATP